MDGFLKLRSSGAEHPSFVIELPISSRLVMLSKPVGENVFFRKLPNSQAPEERHFCSHYHVNDDVSPMGAPFALAKEYFTKKSIRDGRSSLNPLAFQMAGMPLGGQKINDYLSAV